MVSWGRDPAEERCNSTFTFTNRIMMKSRLSTRRVNLNVSGAVPGRLPAVQQPGLPAGLPLQQPESGQPRRADHRWDESSDVVSITVILVVKMGKLLLNVQFTSRQQRGVKPCTLYRDGLCKFFSKINKTIWAIAFYTFFFSRHPAIDAEPEQDARRTCWKPPTRLDQPGLWAQSG